MRSRYQDQQAEGLMTSEELRAKLEELDAVARTAEAEIEKLWRREEHVRALEGSAEELLEGYAGLVPEKLREVSPEKRNRLYRLLRIEVLVPNEGEAKIRLPLVTDGEESCRFETAY